VIDNNLKYITIDASRHYNESPLRLLPFLKFQSPREIQMMAATMLGSSNQLVNVASHTRARWIAARSAVRRPLKLKGETKYSINE